MKNKIAFNFKAIYKDIFDGKELSELIFLAVGLVIQVLTYILTEDTFLSLVSGLTGVISVVLCSQKKMSFYVFGYIQLITYVILCLEQKLYGEVLENVFYFITMVIGFFLWVKDYDQKSGDVTVYTLGMEKMVITAALTALGVYVGYAVLSNTDDTQPMMDSVTTIPAITAQILMILKYRDSWIYWIIIDVGCIVMWWNAENYCMVAQYVFWTINCLYGWNKWSDGLYEKSEGLG